MSASDLDEDEDGERPALLKEISFEQERAKIAPEPMNALRAKLLQDPHGISHGLPPPSPPPRKGRRSKKERESDTDALAMQGLLQADARVRKLLMACHREKWRRAKISPCQEAIANTPLPDIAWSTLAFIRNEGSDLKEAVYAAVSDIEARDYARLEEPLGRTYEDCVRKAARVRQAYENHLKQVARMPKWKWQRDEERKLRPAAFEAGLKALFPLPGCRGRKAREVRLKRLSALLMDLIAAEHPDWDEGRLVSEVSTRLEEMQHEGIPPRLFQVALVFANDHFKLSDSARRSKQLKGRRENANQASKMSAPTL